MTTTYTKSLLSDFGENLNTVQLQIEINNDISISPTCLGVINIADDVDIIFDSALSGPEQTNLDTLISNYVLDNTFGINPKGTIEVDDGLGSTILLLPGATGSFIISQPEEASALQYVNPIPSNYIDGLTLNRNSVSVVRIDAGTARNSTDNANIVLEENKIANITLSGVGGLDTGSESANTWYAIHAIGSSTGATGGNALLSASATGPAMPSGFDVFRRVGWTFNDSGSDFLDWDQTGIGRTRRIHYDETFATVRVLNEGSATSMTDVDLSGFAPPTTSYVTLRVDFETGSTGVNSDFIRLRRKGFNTVGPIQLKPGNVSSEPTSWLIGLPCNNNQVIQYLISDGTNNSASIGIIEFEDDI